MWRNAKRNRHGGIDVEVKLEVDGQTVWAPYTVEPGSDLEAEAEAGAVAEYVAPPPEPRDLDAGIVIRELDEAGYLPIVRQLAGTGLNGRNRKRVLARIEYPNGRWDADAPDMVALRALMESPQAAALVNAAGLPPFDFNALWGEGEAVEYGE